jgi:hypothetical protein
MATVNVSSWAEFKTAVAVAGDTVNLPEGAVWDLNTIEPTGTAALAINCAEINGNGTEITNMWSLGGITQSNGGTVNDLKFTNIVAKNNGATTWMNIGGGTWNRCTLSAIMESGFTAPVGGNGSGAFNFCSMNFDMSTSGIVTISSGANLTACRMTLNAQNASGFYTFSTSGTQATSCEFVIYTQSTGTFYTSPWESCTLRGEMPHISSLFGLGNPGVSIYCADDVNPSVSVLGLTGVTDAQMKSASYLQSINFTVRAG